mgnify:CR=1 FL=1
MKKLNFRWTALVAIAVILGSVFFTSCSKNEVYEPDNVSEVRPELRKERKEGMTDPIVIWDIARPKYDCLRGFWFCKPAKRASTTYKLSGREASSNINRTYVHRNKLHIEFSSQLPERPRYFYAQSQEEITINNMFGYSSITILPGFYLIDYSRNRFGTIELNCRVK